MRNNIASIILIFFFSCLLQGCSTSSGVIYEDNREFNKIKLSTDRIPLSIIRFDGYYGSSSTTGFLFYRDGTVMTYCNLRMKPCDRRGVNGIYQIDGDTISVNVYEEVLWVWRGSQYRFIILDKDNIKLIQCRYSYDDEWENRNTILRFHPLYKIPNQGFWLKDQKWIWENKEDWKLWKEEQKRLKKERKLKDKERTKQK